MKWVQVGLVLSIKIVVVLSTTNLLASRNGDLEADPITFWTPGGSTLASSTVHVHGGSRSAYISGRSQYWEGIEHTFTNDTLDLTMDNIYAFVGFIRLENLAPGQLYEEVEVMMEQKFYNTEVRGYYIISRSTHTPIGTWVEVGGDFKLVDNLERIRIYIQVTSKEVNYYFDTASLVELVPDPNWMANAEANINLYRKANLDVTVLNPENMNLNDYTIELVQDKSEFGHGTAIRTDLWTDPTYSYYPDTVYNILKAEWVTVENGLRWKNMEAVELPHDRPNRNVQMHLGQDDHSRFTGEHFPRVPFADTTGTNPFICNGTRCTSRTEPVQVVRFQKRTPCIQDGGPEILHLSP
ncbi:uncharacterized protein [Argopecten irradians]|uniref:uncharacterized protein n=1 Tax=Argopecten irradians TaxID=31199 RepID=UPI00371292FC